MKAKQIINGIEVFRVDNDMYGKPRYVIHFLNIANDYEEARKRANSLGGRVYRAKWFGGGFVFQSYNVSELINSILKAK